MIIDEGRGKYADSGGFMTGVSLRVHSGSQTQRQMSNVKEDIVVATRESSLCCAERLARFTGRRRSLNATQGKIPLG